MSYKDTYNDIEIDGANKICVDLSKKHDTKCANKTVTQCYRALALKTHPDKHPGREEEFESIQKAHDSSGALKGADCNNIPPRPVPRRPMSNPGSFQPQPQPQPQPQGSDWDFSFRNIFRRAYESAARAMRQKRDSTFEAFKVHYIKYSMYLVFGMCVVTVALCGDQFMLTNGGGASASRYGTAKYAPPRRGGGGPSASSRSSRAMMRKQTEYLAKQAQSLGPGRRGRMSFRAPENPMAGMEECINLMQCGNGPQFRRGLKGSGKLIFALFFFVFAQVISAESLKELEVLSDQSKKSLLDPANTDVQRAEFRRPDFKKYEDMPTSNAIGSKVNALTEFVGLGPLIMSGDGPIALQKMCAQYGIPVPECTSNDLVRAVDAVQETFLKLPVQMENLLADITASGFQTPACTVLGRADGMKTVQVSHKVPGTFYGESTVMTDEEAINYVPCAFPMSEVMTAVPGVGVAGGVKFLIHMQKLGSNLQTLQENAPEYCPKGIPILGGHMAHKKNMFEFRDAFLEVATTNPYSKNHADPAVLYNLCVQRQMFLDMVETGLGVVSRASFEDPLKLVQGPVRDMLHVFNSLESLLEKSSTFNEHFNRYKADTSYKGKFLNSLKEVSVAAGETLAAPVRGGVIGIGNQIDDQLMWNLGKITGVILLGTYAACHVLDKFKKSLIPSFADFRGDLAPPPPVYAPQAIGAPPPPAYAPQAPPAIGAPPLVYAPQQAIGASPPPVYAPQAPPAIVASPPPQPLAIGAPPPQGGRRNKCRTRSGKRSGKRSDKRSDKRSGKPKTNKTKSVKSSKKHKQTKRSHKHK
jgi:hypothetical protein